VLQAVLVLLAVFLGNISPLSAHMQREEFHGRLSCLLQSSQRAGCRNELAQGKQRSSFDCVSAPFEGFGFCFPDTAQSGAEKQMPFLAVAPAWPFAPSRARRLRSLE